MVRTRFALILYFRMVAHKAHTQCYTQSFKFIGLLGLEKKIFYGFTIYGPCWSCDPDNLNNFSFVTALKAFIKFEYNWPSGFREKVV